MPISKASRSQRTTPQPITIVVDEKIVITDVIQSSSPVSVDESIFVSDAATTSNVIMNQQVSIDDQMDSNSSTMEESLSLDDSIHVGIIRNHTDALRMNRIAETIDLPPFNSSSI